MSSRNKHNSPGGNTGLTAGASKQEKSTPPTRSSSFLKEKKALHGKSKFSHGSNTASARDQPSHFPPVFPPGYHQEENSAPKSPQVGAHHVPGTHSPIPDGFEIDSHITVDLEERAATSAPPTDHAHAIVAEAVPELVSARAVPEGEDNNSLDASCFCCGVPCGSVGKNTEGDGTRRRLCLILAVIIIIAIVVGVSVGVTRSSSPATSNKPTPPLPPSNEPTPPPSNNEPTPSPPPLQTEKLFTTLDFTHFFFGHMFDITAKNDIEVVAMDIHMRSTDPERIEVWTKTGQYHGYETNAFQWAKIGEATVTGNGANVLTPLPRDLFDPVHVSTGERQAFYVTAQSRSIYFQERMNGTVSLIDYGDPTEFSNADLEINVGTGVQYLFENNGPPNVFNGVIEYTLAE